MKHADDTKSIEGGQYDKVPTGYNGTIFICPMHPEVGDVEKSDCLICGMFLQPENEVANSNNDNHDHNHKHAYSHGEGADSREVKSVIRQNLFFAFIYNMLGVPIAAGVLYPVFGFIEIALGIKIKHNMV
ncbi:heavy metal-binding domain-containing protein [Psychrobacter sp. FBL11]|uniref:Heavy metal-binding domain-containing protein n=1 Tax=Psychrobacter saeujeotis TaxID=3143436 RepID=A0ABU9X7T2_9GAMM|nr:heavy metal-binding domain-containing protein [uncultured Psychrobacter sp.]